MPDSETGQVTLAVVGTKLDALDSKLTDLVGLFREHCKENEDDSDRITRLEGKVNAWTAIQATFTAIASAVAGFIGTRR